MAPVPTHTFQRFRPAPRVTPAEPNLFALVHFLDGTPGFCLRRRRAAVHGKAPNQGTHRAAVVDPRYTRRIGLQEEIAATIDPAVFRDSYALSNSVAVAAGSSLEPKRQARIRLE